MIEMMQKVEFWVAMAFAIVVKIKSSTQLTKAQAALTVVVAVSGALIFTEPVYLYLGFVSESAKFATASVVALSCEHIARMILTMTMQDIISLWRGKAP